MIDMEQLFDQKRLLEWGFRHAVMFILNKCIHSSLNNGVRCMLAAIDDSYCYDDG